MENQKTTTVKWFDDHKGYGFLTNPDGGEDIFVHHTVIEALGHRTLRADEQVLFTYEAREDNGKLRTVWCRSVTPLAPPDDAAPRPSI